MRYGVKRRRPASSSPTCRAIRCLRSYCVCLFNNIMISRLIHASSKGKMTDDTYECIDGKQRLTSLWQWRHHPFSSLCLMFTLRVISFFRGEVLSESKSFSQDPLTIPLQLFAFPRFPVSPLTFTAQLRSHRSLHISFIAVRIADMTSNLQSADEHNLIAVWKEDTGILEPRTTRRVGGGPSRLSSGGKHGKWRYM